MYKKLLLSCGGGALLIALAVGAVQLLAMGSDCPMMGTGKSSTNESQCSMMESAMSCPMMVEGASTKVTKTRKGVTIEITGKDAATIKNIQVSAEKCLKCVNDNKKQTAKETKNSAVVYTCSMHPEVVQDKPGSCPKCGMSLIKK